MPTLYPGAYDTFTFSRARDLGAAIVALESRVGKQREDMPESVEDRLYHLEMLMLDVLLRMERPPGRVS